MEEGGSDAESVLMHQCLLVRGLIAGSTGAAESEDELIEEANGN